MNNKITLKSASYEAPLRYVRVAYRDWIYRDDKDGVSLRLALVLKVSPKGKDNG